MAQNPWCKAHRPQGSKTSYHSANCSQYQTSLITHVSMYLDYCSSQTSSQSFSVKVTQSNSGACSSKTKISLSHLLPKAQGTSWKRELKDCSSQRFEMLKQSSIFWTCDYNVFVCIKCIEGQARQFSMEMGGAHELLVQGLLTAEGFWEPKRPFSLLVRPLVGRVHITGWLYGSGSQPVGHHPFEVKGLFHG